VSLLPAGDVYFEGGVPPDVEPQGTAPQSTKVTLPEATSLQTLQIWPVSMFGTPMQETPVPAGEQVLELVEPSAA
jgi:hypothetical protein